jgi:hypothetical protein
MIAGRVAAHRNGTSIPRQPRGDDMSDPKSDPTRRDEPTTEEALPGVDLSVDEETEERARKTLGPDAMNEDAEQDEPHDGEASDEKPRFGER